METANQRARVAQTGSPERGRAINSVPSPTIDLHEQLRRLNKVVAGYESVVVAFSGGVDSTLVAAVAARVLGERALAVTSHSPSLPRTEYEAAREIAAMVGIEHRFVATDELRRPGYVANAGDRCYHCKSELYERLAPIAAQRGAIIINGTNRDDLGDVRPGLLAASQRGVRSPLVEISLGKEDVRAVSKLLALPTWDKPAMACLASRIPVGTPVSVTLLGQVEAAEAFIGSLGVRVLRVRHHGEIARIETDEAGLAIVGANRERIVGRLSALGYRFVTLDLAGHRSGSLNRPEDTAL